MVSSLVEALVRPFGREETLSCLFLFSLAMGRLSSESSLGMWIVGLDDSAKLWDEVDVVGGSIELADAGGGIFCGVRNAPWLLFGRIFNLLRDSRSLLRNFKGGLRNFGSFSGFLGNFSCCLRNFGSFLGF